MSSKFLIGVCIAIAAFNAIIRIVSGEMDSALGWLTLCVATMVYDEVKK